MRVALRRSRQRSSHGWFEACPGATCSVRSARVTLELCSSFCTSLRATRSRSTSRR
ncbi:hypothetical protein PAXRUDRAFT_557226 [Paxillus rubicundulus Ve08.2h10]|uniref:Uncharacterized protein n=1 Tax=Paxillus rubicundulus Ve08.2h10 TaxID=930991 RepID=A0A0D0DAD1_9AGAM|nr:hypothetical protein PAXRUDRAFT_557226 [Paxillus rubicundulus Ve08.2h10]